MRLGLVQFLVRPAEKAVGGLTGLRNTHADADRHLKHLRQAKRIPSKRLDTLADSLGGLYRVRRVFRDDDAELVAAISGRDVRGSDRPADDFTDFPDDRVAGLMAHL